MKAEPASLLVPGVPLSHLRAQHTVGAQEPMGRWMDREAGACQVCWTPKPVLFPQYFSYLFLAQQ